MLMLKKDKRDKSEQKKGVGMLILSRRIGETIVLNDDTHLTLLGVNDIGIRVGISSPTVVGICRPDLDELSQ